MWLACAITTRAQHLRPLQLVMPRSSLFHDVRKCLHFHHSIPWAGLSCLLWNNFETGSHYYAALAFQLEFNCPEFMSFAVICKSKHVTIEVGFDSRGRRGGLRTSIFTTVFRTALGPTQPPVQWVSGVKRPGRGAVPPLPFLFTEVKVKITPVVCGGNAPDIRNICTRWRSLIRFSLRPFNSEKGRTAPITETVGKTPGLFSTWVWRDAFPTTLIGIERRPSK